LQIARIAATLPQGAGPRLERLRGFGAGLGRALMCACSRVVLDDRTPAILVLGTELVGAGLPLAERVHRLCDGVDEPLAFFTFGGEFMSATASGETRLLGLTSFGALGIDKLAGEAHVKGHASGQSHLGPMVLERIGSDAAAVLLASFPQSEPATTPAPAPIPSPKEDTADDGQRLPPATPMPPVAATPALPERRQPLRFVWQMSADGRLTIGTPEFATAIGPHAIATLGRPWREISSELQLDLDGQIERAIATRDTWSGITVSFPVDGTQEVLPVELSGLPAFDRERNFLGYRGFGICREATRLHELLQARQPRNIAPSTPAAVVDEKIEAKRDAGIDQDTEDKITTEAEAAPESMIEVAKPDVGHDAKPPSDSEVRPEPPAIREERPSLTVVPPVENVLPFRATTPPEKAPSLTPVERKAFRELASTLSQRLRDAQNSASRDITEFTPQKFEPREPATEPVPVPPAAAPTTPALGSDQRPILDRLPIGVLAYRLDRLLYANRAFLDWTGYENINALTDAGGLDALFIEPGPDAPGQNGTKTLSITTSRGSQVPIDARLFSTPWDGESALVLMLTGPGSEARNKPPEADKALGSAQTEIRELRSILDTATDGVVLLDREGGIVSINRGAEQLFGYQSRELSGLPFAGLFAPESQRAVFDELDRINRGATDTDEPHGMNLVGRGREQAAIPVFVATGAVTGTDKLCAVFRDLKPWKRTEEELVGAKEQAERASSAKSEFLAKISHEIRTPLNAIIGFSEVMMEERFGPVGNDRYKQYLKDIHTSGEHLISLLNDLLDLSKIEAGKLDLNFASIDLNELMQQCVALMQPQASRARIIIRTALSATLPQVLADARSVRQIALNLLSNSIKFTGPGGQVIVSTAQNDIGEVVLRIRDTGAGMSEKDIAIALEPFRQLATSPQSGGTGLGLPLTKALAEANRATFSIKSSVNAGTLIEVAFPGTPMAAE
jgi:PAS domain S-box-containing protein